VRAKRSSISVFGTKRGDCPPSVVAFFQLSQSEQPPPLSGTDSIPAINEAEKSSWSIIRDGVLDVVAALGVTISGAIGMLLARGSTRLEQPLSLHSQVGILLLMELSFLYFGFRRLKANRNKNVALKLLDGNTQRGILSGISVGIALIAFGQVYTIAVKKLFPLSALPNPLELLGHMKGDLLLSVVFVLIVSILGPVCEEFLFRASMFGSAQAINRTWLGAVVASVLFAFVHLTLTLSPYLVLVSLTLCWLLARCRTILGPIAAHITINAAGCLAFLLGYRETHS
jgi:membrane protease YdiL (CAAX protease family)